MQLLAYARAKIEEITKHYPDISFSGDQRATRSFSTLAQTATALLVQGTDLNWFAGSITNVTISVNTTQPALTGAFSGTTLTSGYLISLLDAGQ